MADDRLRLIHLDGRLHMERCTTLWSEPVAVRMVWPVERTSWAPGIVRHDEVLEGLALHPLPTGSPGPDYIAVDMPLNVWLPQGGRTQATRKWEGAVPRPLRVACIVASAAVAVRGDAFWRSGQWCKELRHGRQIVPIPWDKIEWKEVSV